VNTKISTTIKKVRDRLSHLVLPCVDLSRSFLLDRSAPSVPPLPPRPAFPSPYVMPALQFPSAAIKAARLPILISPILLRSPVHQESRVPGSPRVLPHAARLHSPLHPSNGSSIYASTLPFGNPSLAIASRQAGSGVRLAVD
jgi:hypothetical protein